MIEKIIEFSIRNRFVVILSACAVIAWGVYCVIHTPVDAIPDLSENQVIVFTDWMGRSPREIEDQVTYPLSVNLQGLAGVKAVRASSEFNFSMIDIIFEDNVDFYFARERVLERLTLASTFLPPGVTPYLAPDATALGQIFWYTVEGDGYDLGRLRAIQDWYVRYQLNSVPGVAQVASVGGFPIEYQIDVDPNKLRAYGVTLGDLYAAVARSNSSVGGGVIQKGNAEYLVRGVGWIRSLSDIENIVVKVDRKSGTPVYVSNLATVGRGSEFRRSVLEKNGNEVVGAVVMMRYGENPLAVTQRIKEKIVQLQAGLPKGVRIVPFYDRTRLIEGAIHTLTTILTHEMIIASLAILLILMALPQRIRDLPDAAHGRAHLVHYDALLRHRLEHHVAVGHRRLDRHPGGSGDRDGRERHAPPDGPFRRSTGQRRHPRVDHSRLPHGRPADLLFRDDRPALVHPRFRPQRPGRQDVPSLGVHQEFCDDRRGHSFDHARAGADSHVHQGPAPPRGGKLAGAQPDRHLPARALLGDELSRRR